MAIELPYFRFEAQSWQNGNISLESYELQGLFVSICSYYWIKDCSITLAMLQKKYSSTNELILIGKLIELTILKHENRHDKVEIEFLNRQFDLLSEKRKSRQVAGSKGGNAKAMLKQKDSYKIRKDNSIVDNNIKDNISDKSLLHQERKNNFYRKVESFLDEYDKKLLREFFDYWTESNEDGKKMRFESQKFFDFSKRLATWKAREKNSFVGYSKKNKMQEMADIVIPAMENLKREWENE